MFSALLHSFNAIIPTRRYDVHSMLINSKVETAGRVFEHDGRKVVVLTWRKGVRFRHGVIEPMMSLQDFAVTKAEQVGAMRAIIETVARDGTSSFDSYSWTRTSRGLSVYSSCCTRADFTALTGQPS